MAYCWSTSLTLQSIDRIRTVQRKRPHQANVLVYASRYFGLNLSEGQESPNGLMMLGTVYIKPTGDGLASLFVRKIIMLTTQK